ncbi:hypothetical protein [Streptomyces sp. NPDC048644]|uniref:hypothetical protein n=1 Tax=Streptomyces sp. NPDC048644 TaxID=3365582 RepID=UPI00371AB496
MISSGATPLPGWRGGDGNAAYLDKTLRHEPVELGLNERVGGKLLMALVGRAAVVAGIVAMVFGFVAAQLLKHPSGRSNAGPQGGNPLDDLLSMSLVGAGTVAIWVLVFLAVLFLSRVPEPVAEWRVLLADRPDRAETVYQRIKWSLTTRNYPIKAKAFGTRIALHHKPYVAYVSVFNYGTSLYLGWTMWRARRGTTLFARYFMELFRSMTGDGGIERQMLRSEGATVMREAVHLACREGLMVAVERGAGAAGDVARSHPTPPPAAPPGASPAPSALPGQNREPSVRDGEAGAAG